MHRTTGLTWWPLIHPADVVLGSKVGTLQSPVAPPSVDRPWPAAPWLASPWALKTFAFAIPNPERSNVILSLNLNGLDQWLLPRNSLIH